MTELHVLYRFFDTEDNLLYVGITNSPLARMSQHLRDKAWFKNAGHTTYEHFGTRAELEAAEVRAIREEKPKYNIAHSVGPLPRVIGVKTTVGYSSSRDANRFQAPDAIASDDMTDAERDAIYDELDKRPELIPNKRCPACYLIWTLAREHDGLIKCQNCLNMWLPEELPSDLEVAKQAAKKLQEES